MLQPEHLLQMSEGRVEQLRQEASRAALARSGRRTFRRRLASVLQGWAGSLDPSLTLGVRDETFTGPFLSERRI